MRVAWLHLRASLIEIWRTPAFLVPTVLFPTMLMVFFGIPYTGSAAQATTMMESFGVFAVMGVCFYQFGVGIAEDRASPWEDYLRTLPVGWATRFVARMLAAAVVTAATLALLFATAAMAAGAELSAARWIALVAALLAGGIPFVLFGIGLGYWVPAKAAVPIANLIYLPLSFLGGIWMPPGLLPPWVNAVSVWLPSRMAGEIAWAAGRGAAWPAYDLGGLAIAAVAALIFAWAGYRRHERGAYA